MASTKLSKVVEPRRPQAERGTNVKVGDYVVMSKTDLQRVKDESVILTRDDMTRLRKEKEAELEQRNAVANARKKKMLELEEERTKKVPPSEIEVCGLANNPRVSF